VWVGLAAAVAAAVLAVVWRLSDQATAVFVPDPIRQEMQVDLPPPIVAALGDERERHFARLRAELADQVRARWLRERGAELRRHLEAVRSLLGAGWASNSPVSRLDDGARRTR